MDMYLITNWKYGKKILKFLKKIYFQYSILNSAFNELYNQILKNVLAGNIRNYYWW